MQLFELTRKLIDIESTTGKERDVAIFVAEYLRKAGAAVEVSDALPGRPNVYASFAGRMQPVVTLSTHLDTVPPFIPSSEDDAHIHGRGSCDAKGIVASQIKAAERLLAQGETRFALLFVAGEERDSAGAAYANAHPRDSRFLINGEPTQNQLALGSKGALRVVFHGRGRMAHSAYPELGESAIDKLLTALMNLRSITFPRDEMLGPCTCNVGTIEGGRAPNVIPDYARAEMLIRLVGPSSELKRDIERAAQGLVDVEYVLEIPALRLEAVEGFPTTVVSFTTDIPALGNWGRPLLVGPGSILEAHTDHEHVSKRELEQAVDVYSELVRRLLSP